MRNFAILALIFVAAAVAGVRYFQSKEAPHPILLRAAFHNGRNIRTGVPVRIAGVQVGEVSSVRTRTDLGPNGAEISMTVDPGYELKIPSDALVTVGTDGLLGSKFPIIDLRNASAAPARNGSYLRVQE